MSLRGLMKENVAVVNLNATIIDATKIMAQHNVGSVVVVEEDNSIMGVPLGIITDRDIALYIAKNNGLESKKKVREIMTRNVIMATIDDGVLETVRKMRENKIRRIPIINRKDQLIGIISANNLFKLLGEEIQMLSQILDNNQAYKAKPQIKNSKNLDQFILQT